MLYVIHKDIKKTDLEGSLAALHSEEAASMTNLH